MKVKSTHFNTEKNVQNQTKKLYSEIQKKLVIQN